MAPLADLPDSRFQHHVSFDNFSSEEPTKKNMISFTVNASHKGYQRKRQSRTFMVGIDENDYSDIALQWMLEELVDDGDHIVCLRVVDRDSKIASDKNVERREYQKAANDLMKRIQEKNDDNRAITITLEFAVGKVHTTFERVVWTLIYALRVKPLLTFYLQMYMYEPGMLVVGTRGRSLGGFQGLVKNRNSFSKWCLQYSPIPVVVVRPTEKRIKKKKKRDADPTRQDYARILRESGIEQHETSGGTKNTNLEIANGPDAEAHAVAAALGLPARFDPMLKPITQDGSRPLYKVDPTKSDATTTVIDLSPDSRPVSPTAVMKNPKSPQLESPAISGDEAEESEDEDDDEGEFEAVPGHTLLGNQPEDAKKEKLHRMEQGEAGALLQRRKASIGSADSSGSGGGEAALDVDDEDDDDEDEEEKEEGKAATPTPN